MKTQKIMELFPNQIKSGRVFVTEIIQTYPNSFFLKICQQIRKELDMELQGLPPLLKVGYYFGLNSERLQELKIKVGYVFDSKYNLKVFHSYEPQYPKQPIRKTNEGEILKYKGRHYYEHVIFGIQPLEIKLWKSDPKNTKLDLKDSLVDSFPFFTQHTPL